MDSTGVSKKRTEQNRSNLLLFVGGVPHHTSSLQGLIQALVVAEWEQCEEAQCMGR